MGTILKPEAEGHFGGGGGGGPGRALAPPEGRALGFCFWVFWGGLGFGGFRALVGFGFLPACGFGALTLAVS